MTYEITYKEVKKAPRQIVQLFLLVILISSAIYLIISFIEGLPIAVTSREVASITLISSAIGLLLLSKKERETRLPELEDLKTKLVIWKDLNRILPKRKGLRR